VSERKGRVGESERTWAGPAERERRKRDKERSSGWERGAPTGGARLAVEEREGAARGSWAGCWAELTHAGRREEEVGLGRLASYFLFFFFSFPFPSLKLFKQFYLNSNPIHSTQIK
jgi:hypothetical protein